jgi:hypothetical protein
VPRPTYPRDAFDDVPAHGERVGAHRSENPRLRVGVLLAWAALATVLLIGLGAVGTLWVSGRLGGTPSSAPTAAPTSTVTPVLDTSYTVLVLNATGEPDKATLAKDQLVRAGYKPGQISPGEAGSTYPTTTVYYALPEDAAAAAGLAKAVGGAAIAQNDEYQPAGDPEAQQLTLVLGTDRASSPAPTTTP